MTKEKMRIEVALECGWYQIEEGQWLGLSGFRRNINEYSREPIPNYPNDLNACHEMEKTLTGEEWNEYLSLLERCQTLQDNPYIGTLFASRVIDFNLARAEAPQRCEAFLRVKGKWRGE